MGRGLVSVFLPTGPNPFTGYLFLLPKEDVIALNMRFEDALIAIVSVGTSRRRPQGGRNLPQRPCSTGSHGAWAAQSRSPWGLTGMRPVLYRFRP